ncbi:hypothetical protein QOZ88_02065 [Blastococcus sp. BMG 814]|uniref:Uncharacterized protein n=1 Tax=Blastococcus carthaginiensis TaxID=3050034 RepID=A0ABT9I772_9ACTN|nr:hypothetical protein [Blastococcus carthaginiensis]MDP5181413.1 hypothetical protein [Blastococcus carthaginiensis]
MIGVRFTLGPASLPRSPGATGAPVPAGRPRAPSGATTVTCPVIAGREVSHGRSTRAACASARSTPIGRSSPPVRASWAAWSIADHIAAATGEGSSVVSAESPSPVACTRTPARASASTRRRSANSSSAAIAAATSRARNRPDDSPAAPGSRAGTTAAITSSEA